MIRPRGNEQATTHIICINSFYPGLVCQNLVKIKCEGNNHFLFNSSIRFMSLTLSGFWAGRKLTCRTLCGFLNPRGSTLSQFLGITKVLE